ncbi:MAG: hypothetical protein H7X80_01850 [bacterium]|nr:hypothetical protein [Candidatus Kapabacteria bacterium]
MHPDALTDFRVLIQPVVDRADATDKEAATGLMLMFDGVETVAQLRKLDDGTFFTSFYKGLTSLQPEIADAVRGAEITMLGSVMEGNDTAHVVYRLISSINTSLSEAQVVTVQRTKNGWGVLLTSEMTTMTENISRAMDAQH